MVIETSRPIARVAKELGINEGTLGNWVNAYRRPYSTYHDAFDAARALFFFSITWGFE